MSNLGDLFPIESLLDLKRRVQDLEERAEHAEDRARRVEAELAKKADKAIVAQQESNFKRPET